MRADVYELIANNDDLKKFLREQPIWYRKLARNPKSIDEFQLSMEHFYGKTIADKVNKFQNQVQLANFFMDLFQAIRNNSE